MQITPYLHFDGKCEEAIEFYKKAIGAKVEMLMRFKESPEGKDNPMCAPGSEEKIMHSCFKVGDTAVMASDGYAKGNPEFKGFSLSISATTEDGGRQDVQRARRRRSGADAAHQNVLLAEVRHVRRQVRRRLDGDGRSVTGKECVEMQKITPFLLLDGKAEEAMNFYTSVFKNSKVVDVARSGDAGPVFSATIELDGERFHLLNTGPKAEFTAAISFFVNCETQAEVDELWDKLLAGGAPLRCGWLKDKFGLHWQIIPSALGRLMRVKDAAQSQRVMQAMMQMIKIDIAGLERAAQGA